MNKYQGILFCVLATLMACVKPYDFDPQSFEKVLVVDGLLTDQPGPHRVQISYTYPLDTTLNAQVENAEVWVEEDGNRIDYTQIEDGRYLSPASLQAEEGKNYQLFIELEDGSLFASTVSQLIKSPPIDSIYDKFAELPASNDEYNVGGIQFFIDSHDDSGKARYFRYEWEEAYQIKVPFPKSYEYNPEDSSITYIPFEDQPGICYRERFSADLIYTTTVGSTENRVAEFPVRFVSGEEQTLRERYAILVRQYAINESAYLFYKRLKENNQSGGSLFDKQTGSVFGNISSVDESEQPVLGYFEVSGVSEKRAFFDNREFDDRLDVAAFPYYCTAFNDIETIPDSVGYYLQGGGRNIYSYTTMPLAVYIHDRGCTDCSYYADTTPPAYWTE